MTAQPRVSLLDLYDARPSVFTTREKLIWAAMELFYLNGFHAVGLDRIIKEVGVTKTTFYNHFESKDDLIVEVLRHRDEWEMQLWMNAIEQRAGDDPRNMMLAYFDVMHEWFTLDEFRGCMFINATHEFPSPHDPVHQTAATHKTRTLAKLTELADAAGVDNPEELAAQLMVLGEGAITLRLAIGDDDAARTARQAAEVLLDRQLAAANDGQAAA